jgi:hypothetical protein
MCLIGAAGLLKTMEYMAGGLTVMFEVLKTPAIKLAVVEDPL